MSDTQAGGSGPSQSSEELLKDSFLRFVVYVWKYVLRLPPPTRVQRDIARFLETGPKRRYVSAFRGVGKSFLTAAYIVWRLWKNPQLKIVVVSANETFATEIASFIRLILFASPLWAELRTQQGQRASALAFDVGPAAETPDKSPSVKAVGIFGQLTGSRADIILSDDVEVPKNSETEALREKLRSRTKEYADILKIGGEIIYLGTPQTQESIYRDLPSKGYECRVWPARYPLDNKISSYGGTLAPMILADLERDPTLGKSSGSALGGAPTDPERFSEMELMKREMEHSAGTFSLQYQLDTSLSDADKHPLKLRDLIVTDIDTRLGPARVSYGSSPELAIKDLPNVGFDGDRLFRPMYISPEFLKFEASVMHIDPSGRGKDETAYVVTKFLAGQIFIRRWGGFTDGFSEDTLRELAEIARDEEVNLVLTEDNMGDGMFRALLQPWLQRIHKKAGAEGYKVKGQKELRIISALQGPLRSHRLIISTDAARADLAHPENFRRGLYQLSHISKQRGALKHDDRVDVLAQAVAYWGEYLSRDARAEEDARQARYMAEFDRQFFSSHFPAPVQDDRKPVGRTVGRPGRVMSRR